MFIVMKANAGGKVDAGDAVGRDQLVELLWDTIEKQSVIIAAERRIGKTTVLGLIESKPREGWTPVYQDLEKCKTALEFAMTVYREVFEFLGAKSKLMRRAQAFLKEIAGTEIAGVIKLPKGSEAYWKEVIENSVEDLMRENDETGARLLFLWDEMPYMLSNIKTNEGEKTAMDVLDLLRSLRQMHGGLRMVFTGSIGMHHVLSALRESNSASAPTNDMITIEVAPLELVDAISLARQLIDGESLKSPDPDAAAMAVAEITGCFPFYIHHVVKSLRMRALLATPETVSEAVGDQLADVNDPWQLRHFRERLKKYYGRDEKAAALVLDELAASDSPLSAVELLRVLKERDILDDREHLLTLLSSMGRDHYLTRDADGKYQFRFPLIRRWWKIYHSL